MIKIYYNQLIDMVHAIHNFLGETPTKGDVCKLINGCRQEPAGEPIDWRALYN